jgi:DNA-binding MarR family transcriptional regulator
VLVRCVPVEDRLLDQFDRVRRLALEQNPLGEGEVSPPQLSVLDTVSRAPGCSLQHIASALGVTAPSASAMVRRLEGAGLLDRRSDPDDGRAIQVRLTPRGEQLCDRAQEFRRRKMRRLLAGLGREDQEELLDLLERALAAAELEPDRSE